MTSSKRPKGTVLATSLKELKKALKKSRKDDFENGTVIRWVAAGRYTYAAIKTVAGWYTTSNNYMIEKIVTYEELVEILTKSETSNVEVAVVWESVG